MHCIKYSFFQARKTPKIMQTALIFLNEVKSMGIKIFPLTIIYTLLLFFFHIKKVKISYFPEFLTSCSFKTNLTPSSVILRPKLSSRRGFMLVLTRKIGDSILIGSSIKIQVVQVKGCQVRLGIEAPKETKIFRQEILENIKKNLRNPPIEKESKSIQSANV